MACLESVRRPKRSVRGIAVKPRAAYKRARHGPSKCKFRSDASLGQALAKRAVEVSIDRILDAIRVHPFCPAECSSGELDVMQMH